LKLKGPPHYENGARSAGVERTAEHEQKKKISEVGGDGKGRDHANARKPPTAYNNIFPRIFSDGVMGDVKPSSMHGNWRRSAQEAQASRTDMKYIT